MADVLGVFEQAVMVAVVHLGRDGYGRSILKEVQSRLSRDVTASAVYATLDRLEQKGLVTSRAGEATAARGGRPKRYFSITSPGLRALNASRAVTDNIWRGFARPLKGRT